MHSVWLVVAMSVLAFMAVGCGTSVPPTGALADTPVAQGTTTSGNDPAPTAAAVQPARVPAALVAIDQQPAPQSGQVRISGTGFDAGESVTISVGKTNDAAGAMLMVANAVTTADGSFAPVAVTLADELQSGAHALAAVGQTSGRRSTGTPWIRAPQPWLVLDTYHVPQYRHLWLVARGVRPRAPVPVAP